MTTFARSEPEELTSSQLKFEMVLADIAARFLRMIPQDVNEEIDRALGQIREFFESNMCGLFRVNPQADELMLSHVAVTEAIRMIPDKTNYAPRSPWRFPKVVRGEVVLVNNLDELPKEADVDRRSSESLGIQAYLSIPVPVGGVTAYLLHLAFTRPGPAWLATYIPRLRVLAEVLVTALERNREIAAREETEARLELATGMAGAGMWDLDLRTNAFWGTARARELYGIVEGEKVSLETLYSKIHADDIERLKRDLEESMQTGASLVTEYRVVLPDGGIRWVAVRGARSPKPVHGGEHILGVSVDVTERKSAEENTRRSLEEIKRLKEMLEVEARFLRKEIGLSHSHLDIVGKSEAIRIVLHQIEQVAPTDSTVLIGGETGTGKELVARAIHSLGKRKDRLMVKVDCASLPTTLIESELFGRERGAYTGAITKQVGRFQIADKGTVFLDEIAELPRETQSKLLRVLQDGCFEILGSPKTVLVDVRVIAATNRDLAKEVKEGRFREDLYYRLNVFPIQVPPLRERKEDIPMLVWHFVEFFAKEMRKDIRRIPRETMDALVNYPWPGNVREMKNLIEQGFIISSDDRLTVRLPQSPIAASRSPQTLEAIERQHILDILNQQQWRIKGAGGAAALLGMNPSSLYSKMKRLGIPTKHKKDDSTT